MRAPPSVRLLVALVVLPVAGARTPAAEFIRVSPRHPRYFETTDGRPFIPNGLNMVHPLHHGRGRERETMAGWVNALADHRGNLIRIWLWHSWWCPETAPGVFDETIAQRLGELLELCSRRGVRVKITLDFFREIDPASARQPWALRAMYHVSRGGPLRSMDEWWNGDIGRRLYLARLDWLAARFRDRPEIFGWELWNEINAARGSPASQAQWTADMLAEARRRFPRHLVMQSLGSLESEGDRSLYRRYSVMKGNDVAQVHRYLNLGTGLVVCHGPMDVLVADAVTELAAMTTDRPLLLAEGGAVEPRHSGPFRLYGRDREGTLLHDVLFAPFFAGAAGSGQPWHWDQYVAELNLWWHFGRFAAAVEEFDPITEAPQPVVWTAAPPLRVYALIGRRTALAWCRDGRADWRAELERGDPAPSLIGLRVPLEPLGGGPPDGRIVLYDPWADRRVTIAAAGPSIVLPDARRSLVLRWRRSGGAPKP
ncbi:MAG: hypothetical protein N2652_09190 [Kiritimatiellae bacterium]|nr:hypothetical protein [Kiritimatiellia bacterium]